MVPLRVFQRARKTPCVKVLLQKEAFIKLNVTSKRDRNGFSYFIIKYILEEFYKL